jgi:hypothetical protein
MNKTIAPMSSGTLAAQNTTATLGFDTKSAALARAHTPADSGTQATASIASAGGKLAEHARASSVMVKSHGVLAADTWSEWRCYHQVMTTFYKGK